MQSDPLRIAGGWNFFAYVYSSPLVLSDSLGLASDGKCCSPQMTDQDCCGSIPAGPNGSLALDGAPPDARGTVMCCQGRKVWCGQLPGNPNSETNKIRTRCIKEHEERHFPDTDECPQNCDYFVSRFKPGANQNEGECNAYAVELQCLRRNLPSCGSSITCKALIEAAIREILTDPRKRYGCNFQ